MANDTEGRATREELKGNLPGKLRGNDDGELRGGREYPHQCTPGTYEKACQEISNPGLDGMEGVFKKMKKREAK